jgi:hypothetical protein
MSYGQYSENGPIKRRNPLRDESVADGKRVKQVYSDVEEIAHLWAHQAQSSARNPQGNFYFSGDTIYSYGSHFPIARIALVHKGENKGAQVVYETVREYSSTTSMHKGLVWTAIRRWDAEANPHTITYHKGTDREYTYESKGAWLEADRRVFGVTDPTAETDQLITDWTERIKAHGERLTECKKGTRETTKVKLFNATLALIGKANAWAEYVGERYRWTVPESMQALTATLAEVRRKQEAKQKREHARRLRIEADRQRAYEAENADTVAAWIAGENIAFPSGIRECYLRVEPAEDIAHGLMELVTSQGARVPLEHARKALTLIRAVVARGERWERNGKQIRLGHYQIDVVEADGTVKAGCHTVRYAEIERIAPQVEVSRA